MMLGKSLVDHLPAKLSVFSYGDSGYGSMVGVQYECSVYEDQCRWMHPTRVYGE